MKKASALAGICIVIAALIVTAGCGGGGESGATPKQVVEEYMNAALEKDVDTVYGLLSKEDKEQISLEDLRAEAETELEDVEFSYTIGDEEVDGDEASVEVILSVDYAEGEDEEVPQTINLVKEDGEWKVSFGDSY